MAKRSRTTDNLYSYKPRKLVDIRHPVLKEIIGPAELKGCWLVYGAEKHGKTWLALMLARLLSPQERTVYISAEEGLDKSFIDACQRAGVTTDDKILWDEYMPIEEIIEKYSKPRTPRILIIDNLTIYQDELKPSELKRKLIDALPTKLFILLGHEERNLPYPAIARMASKMAKVIFHTKGLKASVVSRFGPGGDIVINEEKCQLFWGEEQTQDNIE